MTVDVRHTLLNLEVTPPPGAWDIITARLDKEYDPQETKVAEKVGELELAPPAMAWANIEAAIVADPAEVEQAPVIYINRRFRKLAAAAAAIVVLALGGWYFFEDSAAPKNEMTLVPQVKKEEKTVAPQPSNNLPDVAAANVPTERPLPRRSTTLIASAKKIDVSTANYVGDPDMDAVDVDLEPSFDYSPRTGMRPIQSANSSPLVQAPPIRDAEGNIILDKELIFSPSDNNYIIVTSPNGEQTRMSSKFLPLIGSLNGNPGSLDYFEFFLNENNIWKLRFNEWRDKMMKQATLIPTATNLLDIIQLKEILQEN